VVELLPPPDAAAAAAPTPTATAAPMPSAVPTPVDVPTPAPAAEPPAAPPSGIDMSSLNSPAGAEPGGIVLGRRFGPAENAVCPAEDLSLF
jgi:hypothetical protein